LAPACLPPEKKRVLYATLKVIPSLSICRKTFHPDEPHVDEVARQLMVREIMEECDVDHDGKISFDEFLPWYRRESE
jgi:Ca2+-binding EF-hand superfamily protein